MSESPTGAERRTDNPIERALLDVANKQTAPRHAAREVARLLASPKFDWRDLARALGRLEEMAASTADAEAATFATAARVSLVALRRAMGAEEGIARIRLRVQEACDLRAVPEKILEDVLSELRNLVDFDIATFVEYYGGGGANDTTLVRGRFAMDGTETFTWPARWIEIDPALVTWMKGADLRIDNLEKFYATKVGAKALENSPVAQEYRKRGAHSVISVARIDGERLRGALSLARRRDKPAFSSDEQNRLAWLGLDRVMRIVSAAFHAKQQTLALRVAEVLDLAKVTEPTSAVAHRIVELIGKEFDWEYVGIFRVARARQQFELVAQYDPTGKLGVALSYTQPLEGRESGMLGHTRREKKNLAHSRRAATPTTAKGLASSLRLHTHQ